MYLLTTMAVVMGASTVDQVVVYPDRAQVTRVATVACGPRAVATFEGIPPAADPNSIRARSSEGLVEGLRAEERSRLEAYAPRRKELEDKQNALELQQETLVHEKQRAQQKDRLAQRYAEVAAGLVAREMAEPKPDPKAWSQALEVTLSSRLESVAKATEVDGKLRELQDQLDEVRRELGELSQAAARKEFFAEVRVGCAAGKQAKVELTYLVGGASWSPAYEARADEPANVVELSTYATLRQATGEDWKGAQVILSTAVPNQNATPPELQPLRVYVQEQEEQKKVLVVREEVVERADTLSAGGAAADQRGQMQARAQGLSVQLLVPERGDVPGNGTPTRLFVGKHRLKASFALKTAPKRMPFVFRTAEAVNSAPFPLLAGPLDAFRRNGFIARYDVERVPEGGLLRLSFGVEEQVRVSRKVLEEVKRDQGLFSGKKRFRYAYRLEVANYGKEQALISLQEQIPVSELDDILVEIEQKPTTPGFSVGKDDGIATWQVKLKPGEKRNVDLAFHVDVPTSYEMGNL